MVLEIRPLVLGKWHSEVVVIAMENAVMWQVLVSLVGMVHLSPLVMWKMYEFG